MKDYIKYYLCLFGTIKEGGLNKVLFNRGVDSRSESWSKQYT